MMNIAIFHILALSAIYLEVSCLPSSTETSWHYFNDTTPNKMLDETLSPIASSIREAWNIPTLIQDVQKRPYRELFFDSAIDAIFRHQHPQDCSNKQFLVSSGYGSHGLVHDIHVEGYGLALALEMGRIYIPSRRNTLGLEYNATSQTYICRDFSNIDCYYELWSNCTYLGHIDQIVLNTQNNGIRVFKSTKEQYSEFIETGRISESLLKKYKNDNVIAVMIHEKDSPYRRLVPKQFSTLVNRPLLVPESRKYYWWRGVSASYLLRPSIFMQSLIKSFAHPDVSALQGRCIAVHIRQVKEKAGSGSGGDGPGISDDMENHSFKDYSTIAGQIWDIAYINDDAIRKGVRTMVLSTDTPQVIVEAVEWAAKRKWKLIVNPIILEQHFINRENKGDELNMYTFGLSESNRSLIPSIMKNKKGASLLELTAHIVSLVDLLRCDSYVCTLAANYCRLVDELRAMIAGKPEAFFADISAESCWEPPCVGPSKIKYVGW